MQFRPFFLPCRVSDNHPKDELKGILFVLEWFTDSILMKIISSLYTEELLHETKQNEYSIQI